MKLSLTTAVIGLLLPLAMAKSVIVSYPKATPDSIIEDAKKLILDKVWPHFFPRFEIEIRGTDMTLLPTSGRSHYSGIL